MLPGPARHFLIQINRRSRLPAASARCKRHPVWPGSAGSEDLRGTIVRVTPPFFPDTPHAVSAAAVAERLGTDLARGLAAAEARRRLAEIGRNELTAAASAPAWRRLLAQFESPLVLLLVLATAVSFLEWLIEGGSAAPYEAFTILAIVIANAVLGYVQEARAEAALAVADHRRRRAASVAAQCDISTGTVIESSSVRVAPPSISSRTRECP